MIWEGYAETFNETPYVVCQEDWEANDQRSEETTQGKLHRLKMKDLNKFRLFIGLTPMQGSNLESRSGEVRVTS